MEIIETGKTIDEAVDAACEKLGVDREQVSIEVIDLPKKSLFKSVPAKVKVTYEEPSVGGSRAEEAKGYLGAILSNMGLADFVIETQEENDNLLKVNLSGEGMGMIIGRRGETLDALQYLTGLVLNRHDGEYYRVLLDSAGYRQKREKTLVELAEKKARYVLKSGRSIMLEPMNPYERRIIHACVSNIEGVTSKSVGEELSRRVSITPEGGAVPREGRPPRDDRPRSSGPRREGSGGGRGNSGRGRSDGGGSRGSGGYSDKRDSRGPRREDRPAGPVSKRPPQNIDADLAMPLYSKITFDETPGDDE